MNQLSPAKPILAHRTDPALSVVVPVRNEAENILPLIAEIKAALAGFAYEVIYIDDGSADPTPSRLAEAQAALAQPHPATGTLRWQRHTRSYGQSAAIITGVRVAASPWIVTLDGDGQNDPADIPPLLALAWAEEPKGGGPLLVTGHRTQRRDGLRKRLSSRIANAVRSRLLGDGTPDTGCGLKVFRRDAFLAIPHFDHMHRFLPALFLRAGGRVVSAPVNHRPRRSGRSNYSTIDRLLAGILDMAGVWWLQRRWQRPAIEEARPCFWD
ncbi:MAG: glycosyltransferase family 2 protein [Acetobacteraceae bacterium]|nr:glycosyltransferase family 2 protein [Acetobacteraceae bacterium]